MQRRAFLAGLVGGIAGGPALGATLGPIKGDAIIRNPAGPSEIVITTTSRLAGAIHSLTWNGREFINSTDHGRQLQSASNFDCDGVFHAETFNPTEAGSRRDGAGPTSTSRLLKIEADGPELRTTSQMAFWLAPGERSGGHPACNTTLLSNHLLTKRVHIGSKDLPQVLEYDVTFRLPEDEHHTYAQFEALTGYMPPEFERFWAYDPATDQFKPLSDGPGEQARPVALATADGKYAMGIYAPPDQPTTGFNGPGYGRFRFRAERVVKWNCVYRRRDEKGIAPGDYRFRMFVTVGTLDDLRRDLAALIERSRDR